VQIQGATGHRVAIVGGGFGGLYAARGLGKDDRIDLTLVDRRNHHLFQPLLYQVATGALAPGEIAQPLRSILRRNANTSVILGAAIGLDPDKREVQLSDGGPIAYDTLVVATGARHSYFGHDEWATYAAGLKSIDDATEIRRRILIAFEAAEREHVPERRREWMTFVVVGGGPTGVELAGALGEIARDTLRRDFRAINSADATIILIEAMDRVLPNYPAGRSRSARRQLERLGVTVRTGTRVTNIAEHEVTTEPANPGTAQTGADPSARIPTRTVLWAAGVQASSFAKAVAAATGAETDKAGRIKVGGDLTITGHPEIFVIGDAAVQPWKPDRPVPGVAQGGIQSGKYVAGVIRARLDGRTPAAFHFQDRGDVAVIGRLSGVTNIGWLGPFGQTGGFLAWLLWLGIHITYLIGFANRLVVLTRWSWTFFTHGRGSRLITGQPLLPDIEEPEPPA
jgi:NADH dehydrogenase